MFEKIVVGFLKAISGIVYVLTVLMIFSIPVIFGVYAVRPPVFTLNEVKTVEQTEKDLYRTDFYMTAGSGRFSPYYYKIDKFIMSDSVDTAKAEDYKIVLDAPLYFTNKEKDDFVISLYVKCSSEKDAEEIIKSADFMADGYKKGFGSFYLYY